MSPPPPPPPPRKVLQSSELSVAHQFRHRVVVPGYLARGPGRQPYTGVVFIHQSGIYEVCNCFHMALFLCVSQCKLEDGGGGPDVGMMVIILCGMCDNEASFLCGHNCLLYCDSKPK